MEIHIHKVDFLWTTFFAVFCQHVYNAFRIAVFDYAVHDEVGPRVKQKTARPLNKRSRARPECAWLVGTRVRWVTGLRLGRVRLGIARAARETCYTLSAGHETCYALSAARETCYGPGG